MCLLVVPSPVSEIGSIDELIISSLYNYSRGSSLPLNVIPGVNPYQLDPFNLAPKIWYLIPSNEKNETAVGVGVWKKEGEAREIYLNAELSGSKTTLEFFDDRAPDGQETDRFMQVYKKTDWIMLDYKITQKGSCHKTEPKGSKSLCILFSKSVSQPKDNNTDVSAKCIGSVASANPNTNNSSSQHSSSKSEVKRSSEDDLEECLERGDFLELDDLLVQVKKSSEDDFQECFERGDFLELDDLLEPGSLFSSLENSTRPSGASDEYFDPSALLRILNDKEDKKLEGKDLSKYSVSTFVKPDEVVVMPATLGSLESGNASKAAVEGFPTGSPPSRRKAVSTGEKKAGVDMMKRLKEFFCFCF